MTTRWPSAVSSLCSNHHAGLRLSIINTSRNGIFIRPYATIPTPEFPTKAELQRPEKSALFEIQGLRKLHLVNPPRSTLPPDLVFPQRGNNNFAIHLYHIGRAYGKFYLTGVKAVWFNYQASKLLRERIQKQLGASKVDKQIPPAQEWLDQMKRSEFQLLVRNSHDIGKLPFFGLLAAVFGEWLPLLVPFIPSVVPGTCRIPKQVYGMRAKAEERRRVAFRMGTEEPRGLIGGEGKWEMTRREFVEKLLGQMRPEQLLHLSCTLNNHNRLWDRINIPPPAALLRRSLAKRLVYLATDDRMLIRGGKSNYKHNDARVAVADLSREELRIACEERGIDVLGKSPGVYTEELMVWLQRQLKERGSGTGMMVMLFRRPNAWNTVRR